jgi:ABC-type transport system involved in multi-copper enzyme maturation permease subunit
MFKLINVEFFKLMRRWLPYVSLLILIAILVLSKVGPYQNYRNFTAQHPGVQIQPGVSSVTISPTVTVSGGSVVNPSYAIINVGQNELVLPWAMNGVLTSIFSFGLFLMIILAAQVVGSEYGWGTIRQTLIKGVSRPKFLTAKFLTLGSVVLAGFGIALVAGFLISMVTTNLVSGGISWGFLTWGYLGSLLVEIGRLLLILGAYLVMVVLFSVLLRSAAAGIGVGLGFYIGDSILGGLANNGAGWVRALARFDIGYNSQQLSASFISFGQQANIRPVWQSSGILLAYVVVFVALAFYVIRRQDLTA